MTMRAWSAAQLVDYEGATMSIRQVAAYLQEHVGQRVAGALAGLSDSRQVGCYTYADGPEPHGITERRLREGYKVVRTLSVAYDEKTARAWLFGTNSRMDEHAPIEVLGAVTEIADFTVLVRAARQVATFEP